MSNRRSLLVAVALLALALIVEAQYIDLPTFRGAPIRVRGWMTAINSVVLGGHVLILALLLRGVRGFTDETTAGWTQVARWSLWGALIMCVAFIAFPFVLGDGPFAAASTSIATLRVLCFAPGTLRAMAVAALIVGCGRALPSWTQVPLAVVAAADVVLCIERWFATPLCVTAMIHPWSIYAPALLPAVVSLAALGWIGPQERRQA